MEDKYWLLGLLVILASTLFVMITLPLLSTVLGDTEKECTAYKSQVLVKLQSKNGGGCEWLATNYILNKNFTLVQYNTVSMNGYGGCGCDIIILVKERF